MKKLSLILLLYLFSSQITAQKLQISYTKSEVYKDRYKYSTIVNSYETKEGDIVIVRAIYGGIILRPKGYFIERYDNNLNLINEYKYEPNKTQVLGTQFSNNRLHFIEFFYDKKMLSYTYLANSTSLDSISFIPRKLVSVRANKEEKINVLDVKSDEFNTNFQTQLLIHPKTQQVVIWVNNKQKEYAMQKAFCFDSNLNLKFEADLQGKLSNKNLVFENFTWHPNNKEVYLLAKAHFIRKKRSEGTLGRYQYELYKVADNQLLQQNFGFPDFQLASLKTTFTNNKLVALGFYSKRGGNRYNGVSYFQINPSNLSLISQKNIPFSEQFMIDKYGVAKNKEIDNLLFRNLLETPNGDLIITAEEYYYTKNYQTNSSGSGMWVYRHHYNDIICVKVSGNGNLKWARNINKKEVTTGDEAYVSYTTMLANQDVLFFINSGEQPQKLSNNRLLFRESYTRTPDVFAVKLNEQGDLTYKKVLEEDDAAAPLMVSRALISKQEKAVYFLARRGSRKQLFKITLP